MGLYKRCAHRGRQRDACAHGWWVKTQSRGRVVRVSLEVQFARPCRGRGAKGDALQLAAAVVREIKEGTFVARPAVEPSPPTPAPSAMTWPQFVEVYYRDYCTLSGLRSATDRRCRMLKFGRPWGSRPMLELAHRDIVAALGVVAATSAPATVRRHFSHVLHAFRWAADNGYLPASPIQRRSISLPAEDNERTRRLSHDEERAIRAVGDAVVNDLLTLALDTGLRFGALRRLTFGMFAPEVGRFGLLRLGRRLMKSKRPFDLPVTARVREVLLRRRRGPDGVPHPPDAAVFGSAPECTGASPRTNQAQFRAQARRRWRSPARVVISATRGGRMPSVVPPAFQFYARDWIASSTRAMSLAARGAYTDLLAFSWLQDGLPVDPDTLRRLVGATEEEWARIWPDIEHEWPVVDGRRRNERQESERTALADYKAQCERGGKARASTAARDGGRFTSRRPAGSQPTTSRSTSRAPADTPADDQPTTSTALASASTDQDQDPGLAAGSPVCGNVENSGTPDTCPPDPRTPVRRAHRDDGPPKPRVIARVAADVLARDPTLTLADLAEDTKRECARMHLPYDSAAVRKGIDAMFGRRERSRGGGWSKLSTCTG